MKFNNKLTLMLLIAGSYLQAEIDGKQQYEMLCGACHGANGQGASKDFPPLADSEWLKGSPDRLVQIVLHGLTGPVTVKGKQYNLAMPPQGSALTDAQIAAITSYVRNAWGNKLGPIFEAEVAKQRRQTASRNEMWTADQLKKKWPPPKPPGPIKSLVAYLYKGEFSTMPDFSTLEPDAIEEEASGVIDPKQAELKLNFAMVWEGKLTVPSDGEYNFRVQSDDGSRVYIDGKQVTAIKGLGGIDRTNNGKIKLKKGVVTLKVEYFQKAGHIGLILQWGKGKRLADLTPSGGKKTRSKKSTPKIPLLVTDEARIYQNFIEGASPRSVGVGYPGGVNIAFSIDELGLGLAWPGDFIDGGLHWSSRGKGFQKPSGTRVTKLGGAPAFATWSPEQSWPTQWQPELSARYLGYRLDAKRQPTFKYKISGVVFSDTTTKSDEVGLEREIVINKGDLPEGLTLRVAGSGGQSISSTEVRLPDNIQIKVESGELITNKQGVFLAVKPQAEQQTILLNYTWK